MYSPNEESADSVQGRSANWPLFDAAEKDDWEIEPLEWHVEPIIPKRSVGFMSGQLKGGKSLLALDLCMHMAHARVVQDAKETLWLGKYKCFPAHSLYVAREDPARRLQERMTEIEKGNGLFSSWGALQFLVREPFDLTNPSHTNWLEEQIQKQKADFLVLDVFNRMIPGLEENSARDMAQAVCIIENLNRRCGVTILLVDHTRKPPPGQGLYQAPSPFDLRGSSAKYGCADFLICLARTREQGRLQVYCENKDSDEMPSFYVDVSPKGSYHQKVCK